MVSHFEFTDIDFLCDECPVRVSVTKIDFWYVNKYSDVNLPDVVFPTFPKYSS